VPLIEAAAKELYDTGKAQSGDWRYYNPDEIARATQALSTDRTIAE
jgi:hypothetical protein